MKLLIQNDDFGITSGVSAGIIEAVRYGLVKNTGMFVNMPASKRAAESIRDMDVCLGIDINYVCGRPVSDPAQVPHLVDGNGFFYKSGAMSKKSRYVSTDELGLLTTFEEDPYPYEEIYLETENQVRRFIELVGRKPEYIHPHSLSTANTFRAAHDVAEKYGIFHSVDMMYRYPILPGTFDGTKGNSVESQMEWDVVGNLISRALPQMKDEEICYFICHGGYVDYELFSHTSLTLRRVKDLDAMLSKELADYIREHGIELITYRNLARIQRGDLN